MFSLDCYLPPEDVPKETYIQCRTFMVRASAVASCLVLLIVAIALAYFWHPAFAIATPFILILFVWRWWSAPIGHGPHWDNVDSVIKNIMASDQKNRTDAVIKYRAENMARYTTAAFANSVGVGIGKMWGPTPMTPARRR
jgi:hypothetical protein